VKTSALTSGNIPERAVQICPQALRSGQGAGRGDGDHRLRRTGHPGGSKDRVCPRPELKEVAGASFHRHDLDRRRDHQALRATMGHRGVLQNGQVISESGQGVPEPILRCPGRPCHAGLLSLHHVGAGQEDQRRSLDARQLVSCSLRRNAADWLHRSIGIAAQVTGRNLMQCYWIVQKTSTAIDSALC